MFLSPRRFVPLLLLALFTMPRVGFAQQTTEAGSEATAPGDVPEKPKHYAVFEAQLVGMLAVPFADDASASYGFGFALGAGWNKLPLTMGIDFRFGYGGESERRSYVAGPSGPLAVDTTREDRSVLLDVWLKLRPVRWIITPYAEGFIGGQILRPHYTISFVNGDGLSELDGNRQWVNMVGYGAGLEFSLDKDRVASLSFGFRRAHAGYATMERTVETDDGETTWVRQRTLMSTTIVSVGLVVLIDVVNAKTTAQTPFTQ